MARFLVVMADPEEVQTSYIVIHAEDTSAAIIKHAWIEQVYKFEWVFDNIYVKNHEAMTINNVYSKLGWICTCVNLDELIMKDLNGGDSNSSSSHPEN